MDTGRIKIFILLLMCIGGISVNAQIELYKEYSKENLELEKKIESLAADIETLRQSIIENDATLLSLKASIDSLSNLNDKIKMDMKNIRDLSSQIETRTKEKEELQNKKRDLVRQNVTNETELDRLETELSNNSGFQKEQYARYSKELTKPYSMVSKKTLEEIEQNLSSFSNYPDFAEFNARYFATKKNKKLFDSAVGLLGSKYDAGKIEQYRNQLYELLDIQKDNFSRGVVKLSAAQYAEIDTLDIKLSRYGNGIAVLQDIVKAVNSSGKREEYSGDKRKCIDALNSIVFSKKQKDVENRHRYFDMIPQLKKLLNDYWIDLQKNPFGYPTLTEQIIMQLKD